MSDSEKMTAWKGSMGDFSADQLVARVVKQLKYEDSLEQLPFILADLMCAIVSLAKSNGISLEQLDGALHKAWRDIKRVKDAPSREEFDG